MVFGVVTGFLLLDERDDRTLTALQVTPLPLRAYIFYRVTVPIFTDRWDDVCALSVSQSDAF